MKLSFWFGLLCSAAMSVVNRFADVPFLSGLLAGAAVAFFLSGLLSQRAVNAVKEWKAGLFHRV